MGKAHYDLKGGYAGQDKNNKERAALDQYASPMDEVTNILNTLNIDFTNCSILEPCAGGGHMLKGIVDYINAKGIDLKTVKITATDVMERQSILTKYGIQSQINFGDKYDFLAEDYGAAGMYDYIIMNPPFATILPFAQKALSMARKGVIMLGRLQFLESKDRYEYLLKDSPPSETYIYVDRISCFKNGDPNAKGEGGSQCFAWYYWDKEHYNTDNSVLKWIRRTDKL